MRSARSKLSRLLALGALVAAVPASAGPAPKGSALKGPAPGITVDYSVLLAGFDIGTARLASTFEGPRYSLAVSANLTGLVGAVTGGKGAAQASGALGGARAVPATFAVSSHSASQSITIRMALARGNLVAADVTPPLIEYPDRIPVPAALKKGVVDPASALIMPALARGALTDPKNCERTLPVFDGVSRFDLVLSYAETKTVEKPGYSGPVLVCNARYRALAGHRPDRPGVKFMEENREMSVWLAPVAEARVLVPMRISVLTQLGTNIIEATRWSSGAPTVAAAATPSVTVASAQ
jgi:hypothetical protein